MKSPAKKSQKKKVKGPTSRKRSKKRQIEVGPWFIAVVVAAIVILCSIPYIRHRVNDHGAEVPVVADGGYIFAIDVSHYQRGIKWDSLSVFIDGKGRTCRDLTTARYVFPVEYVFIKATEGETMVDSEFSKYWSEAGKSRMKRGAYHFFRSSKDAAKQAANFIATVGPIGDDDLPPVLDLETLHKGCSLAKYNSSVQKWLDIVELHYHRVPVIYASDNFIKEVLDPKIIERYPVWVAHYETPAPDKKDWSMWQFTDRAIVVGANDKLDLSFISPAFAEKLR